MLSEQVVLVDEQDNEIGLMDKLEAHKGEGRLHRAVSVLLYRKNHQHNVILGNEATPGSVIGSDSGQARMTKVEVLLQKRASAKPLWPLFWSNTVCTHPRKGERYIDCAVRRLKEELGISLQPSAFSLQIKFIYQARYNEKFSEYELVQAITGEWDGTINPNTEEVAETKWISLAQLKEELKNNPNNYTPWLPLILNQENVKQIFHE